MYSSYILIIIVRVYIFLVLCNKKKVLNNIHFVFYLIFIWCYLLFLYIFMILFFLTNFSDPRLNSTVLWLPSPNSVWNITFALYKSHNFFCGVAKLRQVSFRHGQFISLKSFSIPSSFMFLLSFFLLLFIALIVGFSCFLIFPKLIINSVWMSLIKHTFYICRLLIKLSFLVIRKTHQISNILTDTHILIWHDFYSQWIRNESRFILWKL